MQSLKEVCAKGCNSLSALVNWLCKHPLLFVLFAHTMFSIGIWNARDGYGEETGNVASALRVIQSQKTDASIYVNLIALILRHVTPDPIAAVTLLKYLSSLLATVALCLTLSCFAGVLRRSAIVFACFVWIASSLNAPFFQSTSLSLFTFSIILFGFYLLMRRVSLLTLFCFYALGLTAAALRPEYYLPVVLLTLTLVAWLVIRGAHMFESRFGLPRYGTCLTIILLAAAGGAALWNRPPPTLVARTANIDNYALLGLGQCYADFYRRSHPDEIFSPMTEYKDLLNRTFDTPRGFAAAIKNNPGEAMRYFAHNTGRNIFQSLPKALLRHYRQQSEKRAHNWLYWMVRGILLAGGVLGAIRLYRAKWIWKDFLSKLMRRLGDPASITRKLFLLLILLSTSVIAMVLLVGTHRYFLPWVPLFYLGVAYCADTLLRAWKLVRFETLLVAGSCLCFCSPNFLIPRPNREIDALRQIAPLVREHPSIAAHWADPAVIFAFLGKAEPVSAWDGIQQTDIENGRIDILIIDPDFRGTKAWVTQRDFFEHFEQRPMQWGFKKLNGDPSSHSGIYYRPRE